MRRLLAYLFAAAIMPLFGHFQESVTYQNGLVLHAAKLHDQTIGIAISAMVTLTALIGLVAGWRSYHIRFRDFACVLAGAFALPALWNHWSLSRYGAGGLTTEITSGMGGPLANSLFFVAALAFIAVEACYRVRKFPDDGYRA